MSYDKSEFSSFKDKPDMSMIWLKHMDRTNLASGNEYGVYDAYVRQQLRLLPSQWQRWVIDQEDTYYTEKTVLKFKQTKSGAKMGYKNNPLVWNDDRTELGLSSEPGFTVGHLLGPIDWDDPNIKDRKNVAEGDEDPIWEPVLYDDSILVKRFQGSIDWDDERIYSPYPDIEKNFDYEAFNLLIMAAAENAGLSWKTEPTNSEYGLYPEIEEDLGTATPLDDPKKNEPQEQNPLHQKCWINYKGKPKLVTNFLGYACGIGEGEKPWFFSEVKYRQRKQKPIVILATAEQGAGKTYCVKRLAEIFDKKYDPDKQVVMDRREILKLVSGRGGLKRNQVIIIDEAQFGASSREWGKKEQIQLMKHLAAARFKGFVICIVALHRSMLDNIIRDRLLTFHIHMEDRGLGVIYRPSHQRFDEEYYPPRIGKIFLQLPDYDACDFFSCLGCDEADTCQTLRARYERKKTAFVEGEAEKDAIAEQREAAAEMSEKELAELCVDHIEKIETNTKGFYNVDDIKFVLTDEFGLDISQRKATRVRAYLMRLVSPTD